MNATASPKLGLMIFQPRVFSDARGTFREIYKLPCYAQAGLTAPFVQDNLSPSVHHTLRGLHLQNPGGQGKLVMVLDGDVLDVAVDVRRGSPSFGQWESFLLSGENALQVYVPPGFAHGFLVLSDAALLAYKCTEVYSPADEITLRWNDPAIGIEWAVDAPLLSEKDGSAPCLSEIPAARLPAFGPVP